MHAENRMAGLEKPDWHLGSPVSEGRAALEQGYTDKSQPFPATISKC